LAEADLVRLAANVGEALAFSKLQSATRRDEAANALWEETYPDLSAGHPGLFGAATARAEAQVLRLSLVYALLDRSPVIRRPTSRPRWQSGGTANRPPPMSSAIGSAIRSSTASLLGSRPLACVGSMGTQVNALFSGHTPSAEIGRALASLRSPGSVCVYPCPPAGDQRRFVRQGFRARACGMQPCGRSRES